MALDSSRLVGEEERAALDGLHALEPSYDANDWAETHEDLLAMALPKPERTTLQGTTAPVPGPGSRRRQVESAAEKKAGGPNRTKPKTWPVRRGPAPKPGTPTSQVARRPSAPPGLTPHPPAPAELHAGTARAPVYSKDGWQWGSDQRPSSALTASASVRLEPLRRQPEPEPELEPQTEPELQRHLRPTPPVSARANAAATATTEFVLVGGAAPSALPSPVLQPARLPPPAVPSMRAESRVNQTPLTDAKTTTGQDRSQRVTQRRHAQQYQLRWLYGNLEQPNDGLDLRRCCTERCSSGSAGAAVQTPRRSIGATDGSKAAVVDGESVATLQQQKQDMDAWEAQLEIESPALAKLQKARKERLQLANKAATERSHTDTATHAVNSDMHCSDAARTRNSPEAPNGFPLPALSTAREPSRGDGHSSRGSIFRGEHDAENNQQPVKVGQRWNHWLKREEVGRRHLSSTSPFAVLSGNQVINMRNNRYEAHYNSSRPGGNGISSSVDTTPVDARHVTADVREPSGQLDALRPSQTAQSDAPDTFGEASTAREKRSQQTVGVCTERVGMDAASESASPAQTSARAGLLSESASQHSSGNRATRRNGNRATRRKLRSAHSPRCASPLVGW